MSLLGTAWSYFCCRRPAEAWRLLCTASTMLECWVVWWTGGDSQLVWSATHFWHCEGRETVRVCWWVETLGRRLELPQSNSCDSQMQAAFVWHSECNYTPSSIKVSYLYNRVSSFSCFCSFMDFRLYRLKGWPWNGPYTSSSFICCASNFMM